MKIQLISMNSKTDRHSNPVLGWVAGACMMSGSFTSAAYAADIVNGGQLYQTYCQSCHGAQGKPFMPGAPDFTRGDGLMQADTALLVTIREGKNAMPSFRGILKDNQILDLIGHLRTFY